MATGMEIDEDSESNKGSMWVLDQKLDQPMDEEAGRLRNMYREKKFSALLLLRLAFQSLGVVYGDLGTSPLYVFYNTFPHGIKDPEDVIGALSLIIYSLTLIPLLKYVFVVCRANDSGQGGTFALYSLLCRHAKVKTIPNQHRTDEELTTYSRSTFHEQSFAAKTKRWLERHTFRKNALLMLVLVGTCMVIGDGILTPAISEMHNHTISLAVLSAAGGIKVDHPSMSNGLFSMQHYGTDKVGWLFAPIVLLWFLLIGGIGLLNIWKYDSSVLKAFSPVYIYRYFKRGGRDGWTSLGGIMLSITGTEALFADLAHFPVSAVQIAFTVVVFPCLLLAYSGQAAYLMNHRDHVVDAFYRSIPESIYWPVFIVATAAAIVASQATISATFSIIKQALALGCFPRVKVVHTSKKFLGQIYIPDINWILMILCIAVTAGFKNQSQIGNAYGKFIFIEWDGSRHSHAGNHIADDPNHDTGVALPLDSCAAAFLLIMYVWHYGTVKRYEFEMHSKVSMAWILGLGPSLGLVRVPGIGLVYTELASGVPHIFSHFITNLPAIHSVVVFVCVKYLPVYTVPEEERFLVKRIGPKNFHMFRCVARYGYKDLHKKDEDFEKKLFDNLFMFVRLEAMMEGCSDSDEYSLYGQQTVQSIDCLLNNNGNTTSSNAGLSMSSVDSIVPVRSPLHVNNTVRSSGQISIQTETDELEFLNCCRDAGVVHILGNTVVRARRESKFYKKIAVDYIYAFLRKICRENSVIFNVPHESLLNVGQNIRPLMLIQLAFQSLGVVYGDLGTSPLYVFFNTFPKGIDNTDDVIDALSLIIYSLTLIPLLKYVLIVCKANDNGQGQLSSSNKLILFSVDVMQPLLHIGYARKFIRNSFGCGAGGTFALYSLLCRHAEIRTVPNQDQSDEVLTTYNRTKFHEQSCAAKTKKWLEKQSWRQYSLVILVLAGSSMVIGDGVLTPPISVLSAAGGIKLNNPDMSEKVVVVAAVAILVVLFSLQPLGTDRVSWLFAPIVFIWLLLIGGIGIFNIWKYDRSVLRAFSPVYVYQFFKKGDGWPSLGGIMLCITGTEALFADLSQFPVIAIQIAFAAVVFPCLLLAYIGQAAYLMQNKDRVYDVFYSSIPDSVYWPVFVVATATSIVASQATISATFILVKQAVALGCFPRVKVVHTSKKDRSYNGDAGNHISHGSSYAISVALPLDSHPDLHRLITNSGGHLLLFSNLEVKRHQFELQSKVSIAWILGLGPSLGLVRVPGIGLVYTELPSGVPRIFSHFITNLPAIHSVLIFVCVKYLPVYTVPEGERFLFTRIGPKNFHMFHCVARYGYKDNHKKDDDFEQKLFNNLFRFVRMESLMDCGSDSEVYSLCEHQSEHLNEDENGDAASFVTNSIVHDDEVDELEFLKNGRDIGVVHILGNTVVMARRDSELYKKIVIDYIYTFLRKLCRSNSAIYKVPHESLLNVGQVVFV
ncbi:hypothetical protein EZV62_027619 [Acer yangbiense]|uniref:Potassium transporter n=1 Tax=Acer yangbiense TaxID=1000413 RepID=A0A5C7GUV4_9ROSI|nr:hypothetical protein EZV62_027619 [Acer yangbiense]